MRSEPGGEISNGADFPECAGAPFRYTFTLTLIIGSTFRASFRIGSQGASKLKKTPQNSVAL
jgi:hypothetical protein